MLQFLSHLKTPPPAPWTLASFRAKFMGGLTRDSELEKLFTEGNLNEAMSLSLRRYGARYALNFLIVNTLYIYGGYSITTNLYYDTLASDDEKLIQYAKKVGLYQEILDQLNSGAISKKTAARTMRKLTRKNSPITDIKKDVLETKPDVVNLLNQRILELQKRINDADPDMEALKKKLIDLDSAKKKLTDK